MLVPPIQVHVARVAGLNDPDRMPSNLRRGHQALDRAEDRLSRHIRFVSEREQVKHLLMLYEGMCTPFQAVAKAKSRKKRLRPSGGRRASMLSH